MGQQCSKHSIKAKPDQKILYLNRINSKSLINSNKEHKEKDSQNLTFKISLENLKAKNFSHNEIHTYFNFANFYRTFTIYPTNKSENPHFKFYEDFEFIASSQKLKSLFAILTIRDSNKKDLVSIKLNLYELATGPFHHDMILQNKSTSFKGRILFDLKMKQKIAFFIKPLKIHTTLNDPLKEKAYNFYMKIITSEGEIHSDHSENIFNQFYMGKGDKMALEDVLENENFDYGMNEDIHTRKILVSRHLPSKARKIDRNSYISEKRLQTSEKNKGYEKAMILKKNISKQSIQSPIESPRLLKKSSRSKLRQSNVNEKHKKELIWNFKEITFKKEPPYLESDIFANEFSLNSLQFCLWGTNNPEEHSNNFSEEESISKKEEGDDNLTIHFVDLRLIGECYWSFNKLFREDFHAYETNENEQYVISNNDKVFSEKLWNHGSLVGEIEAFFHIEITPFLRQMVGAVRTESGVKEATSLISQNHKILENINYSSKLQELLTGKSVFIISVLKLLNKSKTSKSSVKEKFQMEAVQNIKKLKEILLQDSSFFYQNEAELFQSQNTLIELGTHLLNFADEMDENLRELYYDLLTLLCNREELNLHSMGFDQSNYEYLLNIGSKMSFQKGESKGKSVIKTLAFKMKIGLSYQNFLYDSLLMVLYKFTQKAINTNEKNFIENFCALSYFRIPEFRLQFLENFIEQTKNKEILFDIWYEPKQKPIGSSFYDWEKHFHKFLKTSPKGVKHLQEFQRKLDELDWKGNISKKEPLFFSLLKEWSRSAYFQIVLKNHVPWNEIPGYGVLVNALLLELKSKSIVNYNKYLKEASKAMLFNEKLLGIFVMIVYKNTRVYDSVAMFNTFELIDSWLEFLQKEKKSIPTIFDYSFFFKGIKLAIEQDHAISIAKCINMIYNNYNLFPTTFKKELCHYLFTGMFFKLFMHWHMSVRLVFHHFLIYRIHHLHRNNKTQLTDITDLYKELMKPHDYQIKNHLINDVIFVWYSNMIKIVEDAKEKLESEEDEGMYFDIDPLQSMLMKLDKEKNPENKEKNQIKLFPKKINSQISHGNSFKILKKLLPSIMMESCYLESEKETIKSALLKRQEELDNRVKSLSNLPESDKDISIRKQSEGTESKTNCLKEMLEVSPLKLTKGGKIYIHRRNIYFNKDDEKYMQIPQEYLKYLLQASKEFERLKKVYWEWFINQKGKLAKLSEEELKKALHDINVPKVKISIMLDEMERSEEEVNEW